MGSGAKRIQSNDSIGEDFAARVLGAHRICVRSFIDLAETAMQHWQGHAGIGRDFCGHADFVDLAHELETAETRIGQGSERDRATGQAACLEGLYLKIV
jgi:hypothetical protein